MAYLLQKAIISSDYLGRNMYHVPGMVIDGIKWNAICNWRSPYVLQLTSKPHSAVNISNNPRWEVEKFKQKGT